MIQLTATHSCPSCLRTWMNLKFQISCDPRCGHRSSSGKLLGGVSLCLSTTTELAQDRTVATDITSIKRTTTSSPCATYQAASMATFCTLSVRICTIPHSVSVQFTVRFSKSELPFNTTQSNGATERPTCAVYIYTIIYIYSLSAWWRLRID